MAQVSKPLVRERLLGERKVDVVIETPDDTRPIVAIAHATGVQIK